MGKDWLMPGCRAVLQKGASNTIETRAVSFSSLSFVKVAASAHIDLVAERAVETNDRSRTESRHVREWAEAAGFVEGFG